jgi:predicted Zn-dependent peptidase
MNYFQYTFDNGIRLVHIRTNGLVSYCGLIINTGSVNETEEEHGIAHFIEHMLFKGTVHRKAYHILSCLEDVGGELNAYTTKDETAVHASFFNEDYPRAMELINDILFHSVFPVREIEKEKEVVIEEINSYRDNPAELIFDDFEEVIFHNQPVGRNILGTPETVKSFNQKKIFDFINKNYHTDRMVFCSVGNIDESRLISLFRRYFSEIPSGISSINNSPVWIYKPVTIERKMNTWQSHCIIGNVAYSLYDDRRPGMVLLNNILGGQGLNSRLNLSLREKNGFAYNVESNYNPYCDTGVFSVYFGTDPQNLEKSISITWKELDKLRKTRLGPVQLNKAKNQMKGYLARGFENHETLMLTVGKNLLVFNKIESIEETCTKIDNISASELLEIANDIFDRSNLSTLIYK